MTHHDNGLNGTIIFTNQGSRHQSRMSSGVAPWRLSGCHFLSSNDPWNACFSDVTGHMICWKTMENSITSSLTMFRHIYIFLGLSLSLSQYLYIYIYVYLYTRICIYAYIYINTYTHVIYTYIYI